MAAKPAAAAPAAEEAEAPKKGGNGLMIVLIVLVVVLIAAVGGLAFMMLGHKDEAKDGEAHAAGADAHQAAEAYKADDHGKAYSPSFKQFPPPAPGSPPLYFDMEQLVVNFKGEGKAKHLAVKVKMMTHYPEVVTALEEIKPILVNDISDSLRKKTYTEMSADDAQDKLAEELLTISRKDLEEEKVYPDLLEKILIERFVMQ
jgi:flagellar FliL protein